MDRIQHLADWRAAWDKVAALTTERDRFARESLELVRAALIYHYNALEMYEETEFHERLRRQPAASVTTPARWPITDDPLFPVLMSSPDPRLGGIFLASASVRLPVAVLKAVELSASPFEGEDVKLLTRETDWNRDAISGHFVSLKKLGCCTTKSVELHQAIAIAVVHRDEFGHGELGLPSITRYRRAREAVVDTLYVCRILQAHALPLDPRPTSRKPLGSTPEAL